MRLYFLFNNFILSYDCNFIYVTFCKIYCLIFAEDSAKKETPFF